MITILIVAECYFNIVGMGGKSSAYIDSSKAHTCRNTCAVQKIERFNTFFYRPSVEVHSHAGKRYSCHQNLNWHGPGEANAKSRHGHGPLATLGSSERKHPSSLSFDSHMGGLFFSCCRPPCRNSCPSAILLRIQRLPAKSHSRVLTNIACILQF